MLPCFYRKRILKDSKQNNVAASLRQSSRVTFKAKNLRSAATEEQKSQAETFYELTHSSTWVAGEDPLYSKSSTPLDYFIFTRLTPRLERARRLHKSS